MLSRTKRVSETQQKGREVEGKMSGDAAGGAGVSPATSVLDTSIKIFLTPHKLSLLVLVREFVVLSGDENELNRSRDGSASMRLQLASFLVSEVNALATDREKTLAQLTEQLTANKLDEIVERLHLHVREFFFLMIFPL